MNPTSQTPECCGTSIEPNRLHHHPQPQAKVSPPPPRLFENARLTRRRIKATNVNPPNQSRPHPRRWCHLKASTPRPPHHIQAQRQRIVVIKQQPAAHRSAHPRAQAAGTCSSIAW